MDKAVNRILIAEDVDIFREDLIELAEECFPEAKITGVAGEKGINRYNAKYPEGPDLLILDLNLKEGNDHKLEGIDIAKSFHKYYPDCKIVIVTARGQDLGVYEQVVAHIDGYLHKDDIGRELKFALASIVEWGEVYLARRYRGSHMQWPLPRNVVPTDGTYELPPLCWAVLQLMVEGSSNLAIREKLSKGASSISMAKQRIRELWNIPEDPYINSDVYIIRKALDLGIVQARNFFEQGTSIKISNTYKAIP